MKKTQCAWYKPEKEGNSKDKLGIAYEYEYELSAIFRVKPGAKK